jgi:hypothetical protein
MNPGTKQSRWIHVLRMLILSASAMGVQSSAFASEAELHIPALNTTYNLFGSSFEGTTLLGYGMVIAVLGMIFGFVEFLKIKKLPAHKSMDLSEWLGSEFESILMQIAEQRLPHWKANLILSWTFLYVLECRLA